MNKQAGAGYMTIPTFEEIKAAVNIIPDCNEEDIDELMQFGFINQSEYEELKRIIHDKNDNFRTAPYDDFNYYGQQGPLNSIQTAGKVKSRLKKIASK